MNVFDVAFIGGLKVINLAQTFVWCRGTIIGRAAIAGPGRLVFIGGRVDV